MGRRVRGFVVSLCALLPCAARADDDPWRGLEEPEASPAALLERLPPAASALADGDWSSTSEGVTVYARDAQGREARAARYAQALTAAKQALEAAGFTVDFGTLSVVHVRGPGLPPAVVATAEGPWTVLVREPTHAVSAPTVPKRPDGPPILRDHVLAGDGIRVQSGLEGRPAGPGSLSFALARHAVRGAGLPEATPPWLRDGIAAWVEERVFPEVKKAPLHLCGLGPGKAPALDRLLDPETEPTPARTRLVGRMLASLAESAELSAKVTAIAESSDRARAAFEAQFGAAGAAAYARTASEVAPGPTCDAAGTAPCTLCRGLKKVEAACPVCVGMGAIACPSCRGSAYCPAQSCFDGWQYYEGGKKVRCKFCDGGVVRCKACANLGRMACKGCSGSGKASAACLGCSGTGRAPCPQGSVVASADPTACPWCAAGGLREACRGCGGCGYEGCLACDGTTRVLCDECDGTGERRMVYKDGTTASASTCGDCEGLGFSRCKECSGGKRPCDTCEGKAVAPLSPEGCPACEGSRTVPDVERSRARLARALGRPSAEETARNAEMVGKAVRFLLTCQDERGAFVLLRFRNKPSDPTVALDKPTLFSNADVLWTLSVAGIGRDDPRLARAWNFLRAKSGALVGSDEDEGIQAASLALRALVAGGEDPRGPLVSGLIARLCKAQRPDGLWGDELSSTGKGTAYSALFPVESLRLASVKGAKVPGETWSRALAGAIGSFDSLAKAGRRRGWVDGTDVASSTALVVMAKAGTLGNRAAQLDVYRSMPAVQRGIAWLDRHFDVREEPVVSSGALVRDGSDAGYAAYLYAIQRLAQMLQIEVLAGERWHATGARHLATLQNPDGSFEERSRDRLNGPVRSTTTAVLFLLRATPPLTRTGDSASDSR